MKPGPVDCPCSCGVVGIPRVKAWADGLHHARKCVCRRCSGGKHRDSGLRKQVLAVKALGVPRSRLHPGHEEFLGGALRTEIKSGGKARTVDTAYRGSREQSDASRAVGDHRPFVAGFAPAGTSHIYFVIRDDELESAALGLLENYGYRTVVA